MSSSRAADTSSAPASRTCETDPGADSDTNFDDPDNLTIDAAGVVYVVEDEDPGDIWKVVDSDRDGVAESMGIWASLGITDSEPTGLVPDPRNPRRFYVVVQHPKNDNDGLWRITTP